jgi:multidrug resistance efflux pump
MANELKKMREIRIAQVEMRKSLENRENANKAIRAEIAPIWTADKAQRSERLENLTKALVEGRAKVREYQKDLRKFKLDLKETNREYDLAKGE